MRPAQHLGAFRLAGEQQPSLGAEQLGLGIEVGEQGELPRSPVPCTRDAMELSQRGPVRGLGRLPAHRVLDARKLGLQ